MPTSTVTLLTMMDILMLFGASAGAVEQFHLSDGRIITGTYDEAHGQLQSITPAGIKLIEVTPGLILGHWTVADPVDVTKPAPVPPPAPKPEVKKAAPAAPAPAPESELMTLDRFLADSPHQGANFIGTAKLNDVYERPADARAYMSLELTDGRSGKTVNAYGLKSSPDKDAILDLLEDGKPHKIALEIRRNPRGSIVQIMVTGLCHFGDSPVVPPGNP